MIRAAVLIAALLVGIAVARAQGLMMFGYGGGANAGGSVVACPQTGLDFSTNCNTIFIPALIH
jgi:hypothetical protein